jgi:alpha-tubulin suppressor-like RCC1 family protein
MTQYVDAAPGGEHTLFLDSVGNVYAAGYHENGRLGLGQADDADYDKPALVLAKGGLAVMCGEYHSAILSKTGGLLTFGCGNAGQLGHPVMDDLCTPQTVEYFLPFPLIKKVALGDAHTVVVLADGSVHAFGLNEGSSLGITASVSRGYSKQSERYGFAARGISARAPPTCIASLLEHQVVDVSAGFRHTLFLTADGTVFCVGDNGAGQLGFGTLEKSTVPRKLVLPLPAKTIRCGGRFSLVVLSDDSIHVMGNNEHGEIGLPAETPLVRTPTPLALDFTPSAVATGSAHTLFACGRRLFGCGWGSCGAVGAGHRSDVFGVTSIHEFEAPIAVVRAGSHHSVVLLANGQAWCAGWAGRGQLGAGMCEPCVPRWVRVCEPAPRAAPTLEPPRGGGAEVQQAGSSHPAIEPEFIPRPHPAPGSAEELECTE